jgi:outer membrane protein
MSELRFVRAASVLLALAALSVPPSSARADEAPSTLPRPAQTVRKNEVIAAVLSENPTVKAALSDCRSAALEVKAEIAHYPFDLTLNSQYTTLANPTLAPVSSGTSEPVSTQGALETSAQLSKHLVWGTDLSLTLDAQRQTQHNVLYLGSLGSAFGSLVPPGVTIPSTIVSDVGPGYQATVKLGATQPLLRGAGRSVAQADLHAARVNLTIAELTRDRTASEVLRDALTAYWESWYATAAVDIQKRSRDTAKRQRDEATARIATGSLATADGLTFETQLASREEDVVNAETEQRRRAVDLARLLGRADRPSNFAVPLDAVPEAPPPIEGDLHKEAALASPELRTFAAQIELARVQAQTAGEALRPRLDLDGYVQAQGLGYDDVPAALSQLAGFGAVSAHVGLTLELPLDDTRHRAERARAMLAVETASHKFEEARQSVFADLDTSVQTEASARRRIDLAEQTRAVAARQLAAEEARYATGSSTSIQVLQAEDAVRSAELRLARARADEVQAHLRVAQISGRLLPELTASAQVPALSCSERPLQYDPSAWRFGMF